MVTSAQTPPLFSTSALASRPSTARTEAETEHVVLLNGNGAGTSPDGAQSGTAPFAAAIEGTSFNVNTPSSLQPVRFGEARSHLPGSVRNPST